MLGIGVHYTSERLRSIRVKWSISPIVGSVTSPLERGYEEGAHESGEARKRQATAKKWMALQRGVNTANDCCHGNREATGETTNLFETASPDDDGFHPDAV